MQFDPQKILENDLVILKPLKENDFEALYNVASDPEIWTQHPNKNRWQKDEFSNFFKGAIESKGAYLICDKNLGNIIGSTRFYDLNIENRNIFIGYTFFAKACWGKGFNDSVKKLMCQHAFKHFDEILFHIGAQNYRSQKSIEKLGAKKIGEQSVAYFGEPSKLNYIYKIEKLNWIY